MTTHTFDATTSLDKIAAGTCAGWLTRAELGYLYRTTADDIASNDAPLAPLRRIEHAVRLGAPDPVAVAQNILAMAPHSVTQRRGDGNQIRARIPSLTFTRGPVAGDSVVSIERFQITPNTPVLWRHDPGQVVGDITAAGLDSLGDLELFITIRPGRRDITELAIFNQLGASPGITAPALRDGYAPERGATATAPTVQVNEVSLTLAGSAQLDCRVELGRPTPEQTAAWQATQPLPSWTAPQRSAAERAQDALEAVMPAAVDRRVDALYYR